MPNPLSHTASAEDFGLSKETTASSGQASGAPLEREEPDPNTDAIPASKQTTASTDAGTAPLEQTLTHESSGVAEEPRASTLRKMSLERLVLSRFEPANGEGWRTKQTDMKKPCVYEYICSQ